MEFIEWLDSKWSVYGFILLFTLGVFLMCRYLPKRSFFPIRVIACEVALIVISFGLTTLERALGAEFRVLVGGGKFVVQYLLCVGCILLCCDTNLMAALFCGTVAYCIQHISIRMTSVIMYQFENPPFLVRFFTHIGIFLVLCAAIYALFIRRQKSAFSNIKIDSPVQLVVSIVMLLATIFIEIQFFLPGNSIGRMMRFEYMLSVICATTIIVLEMNVLSKRRIADEFKELQQLLNDERVKYEQEKSNIDMINMKCHDIRHQLRAMEGKMDSAAISELSETVDIYSSQIKTGNEAIDVVLAKYSLYCLKNDIKLTCLLDGAKLNYVPDHELYALFGNAVENAVKAVEKLDKEKRIIAVSETENGNLLNISFTNYFLEDLVFEEGLPVSSKENHGFGTRSMRMIVEKYGGRLNVVTHKDLFVLNMFFPLSDLEEHAA